MAGRLHARGRLPATGTYYLSWSTGDAPHRVRHRGLGAAAVHLPRRGLAPGARLDAPPLVDESQRGWQTSQSPAAIAAPPRPQPCASACAAAATRTPLTSAPPPQPAPPQRGDERTPLRAASDPRSPSLGPMAFLLRHVSLGQTHLRDVKVVPLRHRGDGSIEPITHSTGNRHYKRLLLDIQVKHAHGKLSLPSLHPGASRGERA